MGHIRPYISLLALYTASGLLYTASWPPVHGLMASGYPDSLMASGYPDSLMALLAPRKQAKYRVQGRTLASRQPPDSLLVVLLVPCI